MGLFKTRKEKNKEKILEELKTLLEEGDKRIKKERENFRDFKKFILMNVDSEKKWEVDLENRKQAKAALQIVYDNLFSEVSIPEYGNSIILKVRDSTFSWFFQDAGINY